MEVGNSRQIVTPRCWYSCAAVIVGTLDLRNMWRLSRSQLDDSVKQQVDLASVALERWLDDQKKALDAIALLAGDKDTRDPAIRASPAGSPAGSRGPPAARRR